MNTKAKNEHVFLLLWIKHDPELWTELRDIQIKILLSRIVEGQSFEQMAQHYGSTVPRIRLVFSAVILKIERCISPQIAQHISQVNIQLEIAQKLQSAKGKISLN